MDVEKGPHFAVDPGARDTPAFRSLRRSRRGRGRVSAGHPHVALLKRPGGALELNRAASEEGPSGACC